MIWFIITPIAAFIAFFVYQGIFSPFARLQKAISRHWELSEVLFFESKEWIIKRQRFKPMGATRVWRVLGKYYAEFFIEYIGSGSEQYAMRQMGLYLESDEAKTAELQYLNIMSDGIFKHLKYDRFAGLTFDMDISTVTFNLIKNGLIDNDLDKAANYCVASEKGILIGKTPYDDVELIFCYCDNRKLKEIQIHFRNNNLFEKFTTLRKALIIQYGIPKEHDDFACIWEVASLLYRKDSGSNSCILYIKPAIAETIF